MWMSQNLPHTPLSLKWLLENGPKDMHLIPEFPFARMEHCQVLACFCAKMEGQDPMLGPCSPIVWRLNGPYCYSLCASLFLDK